MPSERRRRSVVDTNSDVLVEAESDKTLKPRQQGGGDGKGGGGLNSKTWIFKVRSHYKATQAAAAAAAAKVQYHMH